MEIIRREFLRLSGLAVTVPSIANIALAQAQAGPKLTQILRNDLEGQGQVVQETVVSVVEFPPGTTAPWHMHPGAQELLHVIEGSLTVEIEGKGSTLLKAGQAGIVPARTGSPRPQRERKRERQSVGCPQQSGKGQTSNCRRKEIAPSIEVLLALKQRRCRSRVIPRPRRLKPHHGARPLRPESDRRRSNCDPPLCAKTGREQMQQTNVGQYGYSITSSASSCIVFGMVNPSAFAVFWLSTISNLVGCKTGRSAGFAPRRIRPA
jgi:quercetin dioxygenase-like cupin family protein